jgi:hypothetical protein
VLAHRPNVPPSGGDITSALGTCDNEQVVGRGSLARTSGWVGATVVAVAVTTALLAALAMLWLTVASDQIGLVHCSRPESLRHEC